MLTAYKAHFHKSLFFISRQGREFWTVELPSKQYGINTISSADKKRNTHNPIGDRRKRCGAASYKIGKNRY